MPESSLALLRHPFLRNLAPGLVVVLVGCARVKDVEAGSWIFRAGEPARDLFLVESGRIVLESPAGGTSGSPYRVAGAGEALGWSWLAPGDRWEVDGRVVEPVRAIVLDGACLRRKCETNQALGYELAKRMFRRMHGELIDLRARLTPAGSA